MANGLTLICTARKGDPGNFHVVIETETGSRNFMQDEVPILRSKEAQVLNVTVCMLAARAWGSLDFQEWNPFGLLTTRFAIIDYPERKMHDA